MMKLFALLCVVVACQAKNLADPGSYGEYKLIYSWPKLGQEVPNCNPVVISKAVPARSGCKCGRQSANVDVITVQSRSRQFTVLADIVSDAEELKSALGDSCSCDGGAIDHTVVLKLAGGYMVNFDINVSKGFLIGSAAPSAEELQSIISGLPLDAKDGSLVCQ